jgi:hypothetical protein
MQQTGLPRSDTACRTGHGEPLFCRQVTLPHFDTVRQNQPQNCSILNGKHTIGNRRAYPITVGNARVAAPQSPKPPPGGHPLCGFGRKFELSTVNSLPPIPALTWDSHSWLCSPLVTRQFPRLSGGHIAILLFCQAHGIPLETLPFRAIRSISRHRQFGWLQWPSPTETCRRSA